MIYNILKSNSNLKLRVLLSNSIPVKQPMECYIYENTLSKEVEIKDSEIAKSEQSVKREIRKPLGYYLPWKQDTGYYIDIPVLAPAAHLFITAPLTGCCIGVQKISNEVIRICHYNIRNGKFDANDFERYNSINSVRHWLIPQEYEYKGAQKYGGYFGSGNPTCFWGEFTGGSWHFYYQTPDKTIHHFEFH